MAVAAAFLMARPSSSDMSSNSGVLNPVEIEQFLLSEVIRGWGSHEELTDDDAAQGMRSPNSSPVWTANRGGEGPLAIQVGDVIPLPPTRRTGARLNERRKG